MRYISRAILFLALSGCSQTLPLASPPAVKNADVRSDFLQLIDRPRVPLAPEITKQDSPASDIDEYRLTFAADSDNRVPALVLVPTNFKPPRPVIICLHGTGGSKTSMLPIMRQLAAKGFITVAADGPHHGERQTPVDYETAIVAAYNGSGEHPFFYDTVWDTMRLIDYLQTRSDVDPARIGLYGVSKGGIETYLMAAVDPRVTVAIPTISMESFRWAEENNQWQPRIGTIPNAFAAAAKEAGVENPDARFVHLFYSKVAPGIDAEFDGPSMITLIAPRPLMLINGELDPRNPLSALKLCTDAAQTLYHAANADDKFQSIIEPHTAHKVTKEAEQQAIAFFIQWLSP